MTIGLVIVPLPQILASQGIPGGRIAVAVAVMTSSRFWGFLLAPILDVWFRRRTYALVSGLLAGLLTAFVILNHDDLTGNLPIVYMEVIDGHGFDWRGVTGQAP